MSDEVAPLVGEDVPKIDEVLAGALVTQGEAGVRALGLLRDARRVLAGVGLERPGEIAESCLRGAVDALLSLSDAPVVVGLKSAARELLDAVDACSPAADAAPVEGLSAEASASEAWERVVEAAEVLRGELGRPGGYHRGRARGIAERLMGVMLGSEQEVALEVWGRVYGATSGTLHGGAADPGRAVRLYGEVLAAARELLVPLPGRAARVLELAALADPGPGDALELARWADPRATAYFFGSKPSSAWLPLLQEHAAHLLMPDPATEWRWPAAPFLEHLTTSDPGAARDWLASHAEDITAVGREAANGFLRLAARDGIVLAPQVHALLEQFTGARAEPHSWETAWTLRLAIQWALSVPLAVRDCNWILVTERLLAEAVDGEHAVSAVRREASAEREAAFERANAGGKEADLVALAIEDARIEERIASTMTSRMSMQGHEVARLLRELVRTAYPASLRGGAHPRVRMIRAVVTGLLRQDLELTDPEARRIVFGDFDLDQVHVGDSATSGGPRLARTVLDLAAVDAAAGASLAERTHQWKRLTHADAWLHGRLLAAHLTHFPPAGGAPVPGGGPASGEEEWWQEASALVPCVLVGYPAPETARLVEVVLHTCPPDRAVGVEEAARAALGAPPPAELVDQILPPDADRADGNREPLAGWLRVWDWSPALPARLLTGWEPVMTALHRLVPEGPADPRTVVELEPIKPLLLEAEELVEWAAEHGPVATAARLAAADDIDAAPARAILLVHRLVKADPAGWTSDVPAVLEAFQRPEFAAIYLAAAVQWPGAFPHGPAQAAAAALDVHRAVAGPPAGADAGRDGPAAGSGLRTGVVHLADEALFGLLTRTWRSGGDLADDLPRTLDYLHALAAVLTQTAGTQAPDGADPAEGDGMAPAVPPEVEGEMLLGSDDPEVRALQCLLEYAIYRARIAGPMPQEVLEVVAGAITARSSEERVVRAVGVYLPTLHRYAPAFAADHRAELYGIPTDRPSPAAAWLRWGPPYPPLLAALDRTELLQALRTGARGAAEHLAHALMADPAFLGEPTAAWAELAAGTGGPAAVSRLLEAIAARTPRTGTDEPAQATAAPKTAAATDLWRAALAANLPPGALAGAGTFAAAALDDAVWLPLTRSSAEHSPALTNADLVAERAASHPHSPDALLLAAQLVAYPVQPWQVEAVRRHARTLLDAAAALPEAERPAALQELREALVNAGDVDTVRT
ncbi:hypothetical protein [Streptomyces sp. NPDC002845]